MSRSRAPEPVDPAPGFSPSDPVRREIDLARGLGAVHLGGWRRAIVPLGLLAGLVVVGAVIALAVLGR